MSYLEELLPEFRNGAKIRRKCWERKEFIVYDMGSIKDERNVAIYTEVSDYADDLLADDWELYQNSVDWDYIIKNRCLCWFWDDENDENFIARLEAFNMDDDNMRFKSKNGAAWRNCRPVRRDEVNFYDGGDDEKI